MDAGEVEVEIDIDDAAGGGLGAGGGANERVDLLSASLRAFQQFSIGITQPSYPTLFNNFVSSGWSGLVGGDSVFPDDWS